jgi:hypothetical protein
MKLHRLKTPHVESLSEAVAAVVQGARELAPDAPGARKEPADVTVAVLEEDDIRIAVTSQLQQAQALAKKETNEGLLLDMLAAVVYFFHNGTVKLTPAQLEESKGLVFNVVQEGAHTVVKVRTKAGMQIIRPQ